MPDREHTSGAIVLLWYGDDAVVGRTARAAMAAQQPFAIRFEGDNARRAGQFLLEDGSILPSAVHDRWFGLAAALFALATLQGMIVQFTREGGDLVLFASPRPAPPIDPEIERTGLPVAVDGDSSVSEVRDPALPAVEARVERDVIERELRQRGVASAGAIATLAEPAFGIQLLPSCRGYLGASRLGGVPDVPEDFRWPVRRGQPLSFLAQIDLADLRADVLPSTGTLLFFYDAVDQPAGWDPHDAGAARVYYFACPRAQLRRVRPPAFAQRHALFERRDIAFFPRVDLPSEDDYLLRRREDAPALGDQNWITYASAQSSFRRRGHPDGKDVLSGLLGHPILIQGDMRLRLPLLSRGITMKYRDRFQEPYRSLIATAHEWRLLLQLDSMKGAIANWVWGDAGSLYFWIRGGDLRERRLEGVWAFLQSS